MKETTNNTTNNTTIITGVISKTPEFSHEILGERFYGIEIEVLRKSEQADYIPVLVTDRMVDIKSLKLGEYFKIEGSYRSHNEQLDNGKSKLILQVFPTMIEKCEAMPDDKNKMVLSGYICKPPVCRTTPLGREITDLLLAVNRPYGKSDYIPCICWGRNASYVGTLEVGTHINCEGRIQSREYTKRISETESIKQTAYEVSVSMVEMSEEGVA